MPKLTERENKLLKDLGSSLVMGSARLKEVSAFMHRLMFLADEADKAKASSENARRVADFRYSFIAGAVHGILSKEDILAKELPGPLQEEALALRQQHDDAKAYNTKSIPAGIDSIDAIRATHWVKHPMQRGDGDEIATLCALHLGDDKVYYAASGAIAYDYKPFLIEIGLRDGNFNSTVNQALEAGDITEELATFLLKKHDGYPC